MATLFLCLITAAIGLWVLSASGTLETACSLSAHTGGTGSCVSGLPYQLIGIGLITAGAVSVIIVLAGIRSSRRVAARRHPATISTLRQGDAASLRDVA